ncbi:hypothetical protein [Actinomadura macrotermitis]|uniref:Uncharacterized protein n=1 Tax=Actinomadura macrotermitis TaxID=2585200 RepID=A0A7K0BMZ1_9ACTN|nr:hypothetical protein [Actinomadura macrotermitis]MQY02540.1 hypothetical protein [Actinomadura macrotermitis]
MELKPVALYREMYGGEREDLPSIHNASGRIVEPDRAQILEYMRTAKSGLDVMEAVPDLFTPGEHVNTSLQTDGTWIWRVDSVRYATIRPLVLPALFIEDVRARGYVPPAPEWTEELSAAVQRWW